MSKSLTYLVFFGRFSINGGENIFLSFSFLIVNSLSPGKRQIFSFDSSQSIEHHFDFPLLIAQSILWYLYRAGNWERFGLHRPTTLFVCDRPLPIYPLCLSQDAQLGWVGGGGGVGRGGYTPFYGQYWLERGTFFLDSGQNREGISLAEVRKRVVKIIFVWNET